VADSATVTVSKALARRYFHSLSTHIAIASDFDQRCDRYHSRQRNHERRAEYDRGRRFPDLCRLPRREPAVGVCYRAALSDYRRRAWRRARHKLAALPEDAQSAQDVRVGGFQSCGRPGRQNRQHRPHARRRHDAGIQPLGLRRDEYSRGAGSLSIPAPLRERPDHTKGCPPPLSGSAPPRPVSHFLFLVQRTLRNGCCCSVFPLCRHLAQRRSRHADGTGFWKGDAGGTAESKAGKTGLSLTDLSQAILSCIPGNADGRDGIPQFEPKPQPLRPLF